jgi:hypothetical protein
MPARAPPRPATHPAHTLLPREKDTPVGPQMFWAADLAAPAAGPVNLRPESPPPANMGKYLERAAMSAFLPSLVLRVSGMMASSPASPAIAVIPRVTMPLPRSTATGCSPANVRRVSRCSLVEGTTDPEVLADLAKARLRKKIPASKEALEGHFSKGHHAFMVGRMLAHIDYLDESIADLSSEIERGNAPLFRSR